MNIELIKTYILSILVLISLLLTSALWNYQPNYQPLYGSQSKYLSEVDIGGKEETKHTIIEPNTVIFKLNEGYKGFTNPSEQRDFYREMQEWMLDDFQINQTNNNTADTEKIEVIFPNEMPIEIIKSLFTTSEQNTLPNWSFQRMEITFNESESNLNVLFLSIDGNQQVKYVVKDSSVYSSLLARMQGSKGLSEYMAFGSSNDPIYIPTQEVEMKARSLAVEIIDSNLLVDALFDIPSLVSANFREGYFTDGQRGMRMLQENRSMEYINPIHSSDEQRNVIGLLEQSLMSVNEHKGWTDNYTLVDIDTSLNSVRYRMNYDGYPVHNLSNLSIIEQQWVNQELHIYRRPLFNLKNILSTNTVTLPSGEDIVDYVTNNSSYKISNIQDIQIGYRLTYLDRISYSLSLEPAWYIKYNSSWHELKMDELSSNEMGGG